MTEPTNPPTNARTAQVVLDILQAPTPGSEISWLPRGVKSVQGDAGKAVAIPYVSSDFVENRLDEACGAFGWQTKITTAEGLIAFGVGIFDPDRQEWLWRWDVGSEGKAKKGEHGEKEEATAAFKRAARQWGIARDLKDLPKLNVRCQVRMKGQDAIFIRWTEEPEDVIERFLGSSTKRADPEIERAETPVVGEGGEVEPVGKSKEPTPAEARKILFNYMTRDLRMTLADANKEIVALEKTFPKNLTGYRQMYDKVRKSNEPPGAGKDG